MAATGTPTTAPKKFDKKVLAHTGAGIICGLLIVFCITQCNGKKKEREEKEAARTELSNAANRIDGIAGRVDSLLNVNRGLTRDNQVQADSIVVLNDSIVVLNDSINSLTDSLTTVNGQLRDCRNGRRITPPRNNNGNNNGNNNRNNGNDCGCDDPRTPVRRPSRPRVISVDTVRCGNNSTVQLGEKAENGGNIVIVNDCANGNTNNVTLGNGAINEGTIIINNGGTVATGLQNAADSLKSAANNAQNVQEINKTVTLITTRRVKVR